MMSTIEILRINAVQMAHSLCKICFHGFYEQMVVVPHLAKAMNKKVVAIAGLPEQR
jgi:hypothetical protein